MLQQMRNECESRALTRRLRVIADRGAHPVRGAESSGRMGTGSAMRCPSSWPESPRCKAPTTVQWPDQMIAQCGVGDGGGSMRHDSAVSERRGRCGCASDVSR